MMRASDLLGLLQQPGKTRQLLGYLALFLFLLPLFAYWRFPATTLTPFLQRTIDNSSVDAKIRIGNASLTIIPGMTIKNIRLAETYKNAPVSLVIDQLTIYPAWVSSLTGSPGIDVTANLLAGQIWGTIRGDGLSGDQIEADISFEQIDPGRAPQLKKSGWGTISGLLSGNGSFRIIRDKAMEGTGQLEAIFTEGLINLPPHLLKDVPPINIDKGEAMLTWDKGVVSVDSLSFSGAMISGSLSGEIILARIAKFSRLNLTLKLLPKGELKKRIEPFMLFLKPGPEGELTFKIGGTVESPKLG